MLRTKIINSCKKNTGNKSLWHWIRKCLLIYDTKNTNDRKIYNLEFKIKNFCASKHMKMLKRQPQNSKIYL